MVDGTVDALLVEAFSVQMKAGSDGKDKVKRSDSVSVCSSGVVDPVL